MVEEESAAGNSIANCNCSVYSYSSVARFGGALHQKHWHWKHLRWAPEQRRAPKAPFSASIYKRGTTTHHDYLPRLLARELYLTPVIANEEFVLQKGK